MTLDEFVSRYNGKKVSNGGLSQCVALARQYLDDVLKVPQFPTVQGAYQIFDVLQGFEKVLNTPTGVPPRGAIIIWKKEYGGVGHVGIVLQADVKGILVFSQNHTGNLDPCEVTSYSYNLVKGWLIRKDEMIPADKVKGNLFDAGDKVLYHIPDPDTANKYFGDWSQRRPLSDIIPPQIIEKPVEVPFETIKYQDTPETIQELLICNQSKAKYEKEISDLKSKVDVYEQTESEDIKELENRMGKLSNDNKELVGELSKIRSENILIRRDSIANFFRRLYNLVKTKGTK